MPFRPDSFHVPNFRSGAAAPAFSGALDAHTTNLVSLYGVFHRLLSGYTGSLFRVRRSSDSTEQDIGYLSDGTLDIAALTSFLGGSSGFIRTLYDQSGNGHHQQQAIAASQPQIGVDGNGQYYIYAPGAGFTTTRMQCTGLSLPCTDFTFWNVSAAAGYMLGGLTTRDNVAFKERSLPNFSSAFITIFDDNATGTAASIGSTNTSPYSSIWAAGSGGNKLSNRLTTTTGTRVPNACTINEINIGSLSGAAAWAQNSAWYLAGFWGEDKGPAADFAALATLGKTLITAAQ